MKKIILSILTLLASTVIFAQDHFFTIENGSVVWQKIYDTKLSQRELIDIIVNSGDFTEVTELEDRVTFRAERIKFNSLEIGSELGFQRKEILGILDSFDISCFVTIQFKPDRYRVTANNLRFVQNHTRLLLSGDKELIFEDFLLNKNGEWRINSGKDKSLLPILSYGLDQKFLMEQKELTVDDEW